MELLLANDTFMKFVREPEWDALVAELLAQKNKKKRRSRFNFRVSTLIDRDSPKRVSRTVSPEPVNSSRKLSLPPSAFFGFNADLAASGAVSCRGIITNDDMAVPLRRDFQTGLKKHKIKRSASYNSLTIKDPVLELGLPIDSKDEGQATSAPNLVQSVLVPKDPSSPTKLNGPPKPPPRPIIPQPALVPRVHKRPSRLNLLEFGSAIV
jgi:hypothetical protein